jgi:hypothetical protein
MEIPCIRIPYHSANQNLFFRLLKKKKFQKVKTFKAAGRFLRKPPARRNKRSDWFIEVTSIDSDKQ